MRREVHVVDAAARHRQRVADAERVRVAEVEPVQALGDDDREPAVGREVQVVGVGDGNGAAGPRRPRIDRSDRVALVVQHVQRLQVPGRRDVLRQRADRELLGRSSCGEGRSRRPCCCRCSGRRRAEVRVAWRGGTCSGRPRHRRRPPTSCGRVSHVQRASTDDCVPFAPRPPATRMLEPSEIADASESGCAQMTRRANPSGARVDRLDPGGRRVEARSASSDHVREAAKLGRGCMRGRPGQASERGEALRSTGEYSKTLELASPSGRDPPATMSLPPAEVTAA